eukprot:PhM_4_TR14067/c0_g2_i2/m.9916
MLSFITSTIRGGGQQTPGSSSSSSAAAAVVSANPSGGKYTTEGFEAKLGRMPQKLHNPGSVFARSGSSLHGGKSLEERLHVKRAPKRITGPMDHHVSLRSGLMHKKLGDGIF